MDRLGSKEIFRAGSPLEVHLSSQLSELPRLQQRPLWRPRSRAAFAAVALLLLGFGALAWHYHRAVKEEQTGAVLARNAALVTLAAATLSERLDRSVDLAVSLATRVRFAELVAGGEWDAAIAILHRVPQEFRQVDRILLASPDGVVMSDVPPLPGARGQSFAYRDWYRGVSREWKPHVSAVYRRAAEPRLNVVAVAVPVREQKSGRVTGILVLQLSLEALFEEIRGVVVEEVAMLTVVDAQGQAAYRRGVPHQAPIADLSAHPAVQRVRQGHSAAELGRDPGTGEETLHAFDPLRYGWGVILERPAASAFAARDRQLGFIYLAFILAVLFLASVAWLGVRLGRERQLGVQVAELRRTQETLAKQAERLRIVHEIDRAISAEVKPEAIARAVLQPLRRLLDVARANINLIDEAAGDVEWFASAGRRRTHVGSGLRFPLHLIGDVEALRRGEPQRIDTRAQPPGKERDALLASGVHYYIAIPMVAAGDLIGAVSFGGTEDSFPEEQVTIALEVATQLAVAISNARLYQKVRQLNADLEQKVRERTNELEVANKELESFSYSVSHDLRAPLRAVDGYARMLEEDHAARLDEEGRRLLGVVRESSVRMGQLIDDLLKFSQVSRRALAVGPVDQRALASEVLAELAAAAPKVRVDLGPLPRATGDRALLRQVWVNLLGNAFKYSSRREAPRVEVGARIDGGECVYWVRDNGAGFDMRYADKLFNVFQRLHSQEEFTGTGVGLAIVQRVIVRHGGRVWAEGKVGEGACFYFSLPLEGGESNG